MQNFRQNIEFHISKFCVRIFFRCANCVKIKNVSLIWWVSPTRKCFWGFSISDVKIQKQKKIKNFPKIFPKNFPFKKSRHFGYRIYASILGPKFLCDFYLWEKKLFSKIIFFSQTFNFFWNWGQKLILGYSNLKFK